METSVQQDGSQRVVALVDATFARTIARLLDFGAYPSWLAPLVKRVEVLRRVHGHATVYVEIDVEGTTSRWAELDVRIDGTNDGTHTIVGRAIDGDMRALDARISLVATPGRVRALLSTTMRIDPDVPFVGDVGREAGVRFVHALRQSLR